MKILRTASGPILLVLLKKRVYNVFIHSQVFYILFRPGKEYAKCDQIAPLKNMPVILFLCLSVLLPLYHSKMIITSVSSVYGLIVVTICNANIWASNFCIVVEIDMLLCPTFQLHLSFFHASTIFLPIIIIYRWRKYLLLIKLFIVHSNYLP